MTTERVSTTVPLNWKEVWFTNCPMVSANNVDQELGWCREEFKKVGHLKGEMVYHKYQERGFSTPTGKVELYSTVLEKWGYDPLPKYTEIPESPVSKPELAKRFPYILNAGFRTPTFFHSASRDTPSAMAVKIHDKREKIIRSAFMDTKTDWTYLHWLKSHPL